MILKECFFWDSKCLAILDVLQIYISNFDNWMYYATQIYIEHITRSWEIWLLDVLRQDLGLWCITQLEISSILLAKKNGAVEGYLQY